MKKILVFILMFFAVLSSSASAHSPSSMSLNYDSGKSELVVTIIHTVADTSTHYIINIEIEKNNESYKNFDYTSQPTSSSFSYTYSNISAENGDVFTLSAYCIQGGHISKSLTVGSTTEEKKESPGFELIIVFVAIMLILFLKRKKAL